MEEQLMAPATVEELEGLAWSGKLLVEEVPHSSVVLLLAGSSQAHRKPGYQLPLAELKNQEARSWDPEYYILI